MGHIQGPTPNRFYNIVTTELGLRLRYNTDPNQWTCAFIGLFIDVDKNNFIFIGKKENTTFPNIHQNITPHNIKNQFNQPMYSILSKNKQKIYLNYQNYQRHCKGVLKNICHQPLRNHWITNLQCHQCLLRQC